MINGAHSIIYSTDPEADRNFFRDVLKLTKVDVGQGQIGVRIEEYDEGVARVAFFPRHNRVVGELDRIVRIGRRGHGGRRG